MLSEVLGGLGGEGSAWLDAAPTWLGLAGAFCALAAARVDAGGGSALLATLACLLSLLLVQALWRGPVQRAVWWRRRAARPGAAAAAPVPVTVQPQSAAAIATGLDTAQVLVAARSRFMRLQAAWAEGDIAALQSLTTPDMLAELLQVLDEKLAEPGTTDVVSLHAELLGLEELGAAYLACVEFSGLIRESADAGAVPFRELWMLSSDKGDSPSWRLARQQALF